MHVFEVLTVDGLLRSILPLGLYSCLDFTTHPLLNSSFCSFDSLSPSFSGCPDRFLDPRSAFFGVGQRRRFIPPEINGPSASGAPSFSESLAVRALKVATSQDHVPSLVGSWLRSILGGDRWIFSEVHLRVGTYVERIRRQAHFL